MALKPQSPATPQHIGRALRAQCWQGPHGSGPCPRNWAARGMERSKSEMGGAASRATQAPQEPPWNGLGAKSTVGPHSPLLFMPCNASTYPLRGQHYMPQGSPPCLCLSFPLSLHFARALGDRGVPRQPCQQRNNQAGGLTRTVAWPDPRHGHSSQCRRSKGMHVPTSSFDRKHPSKGRCPGLAEQRSCWCCFS